MLKLIYIASGGAIGAVLRYLISGLFSNVGDGEFPYGTLAVNLLGSLIIGFLWTLFMERISFGPEIRAMVLTGFLGAFTTFSTYSLESINLLQAGQYKAAIFNIFLNNFLSLALCLSGVIVASKFIGR